MKKKLTTQEVLKKYKGRYIDTYSTYDYEKHQWLHEVRSVKRELWENHNLPEIELSRFIQ